MTPPAVLLLDASREGLDDVELHARARGLAAASGAGFRSRSYCFPYAIVACHERPVGVDIERVEPCDAGFAETIRTASERAAAHVGGLCWHG